MAFWRREKSDAELSLERLQSGVGSAETAPAPSGPFSMTIEDVFVITGRGTVVTGRIATGTVRVGMPVTIATPAGPITTTVRSVEQFRKVSEEASAGANVGLLLDGVAKGDVARGDVVSSVES